MLCFIILQRITIFILVGAIAILPKGEFDDSPQVIPISFLQQHQEVPIVFVEKEGKF